ncbi:MAG TPA: carbohydrate-binding domain-containing protein, partial [Rhodopila sp.]|nr:carbohydrate-binding domain-containing protein [Rhodopila sp.]
DTTAVPAGATPQSTTTPAPVSVGSGADTLVLNMAEDPYQGDAQFTISVDGKQIGATQTTTAVVDQGQSQEFDVHGDFGSGTHTVSVNFLNDQIGDFYPGTQWAVDTTDRNLYVMGASLNGGTPASGAPWELSSNGSHDFTVTAGNDPSATAGSSGLFAADGAAATSSNPALPNGSLGSSGMSFISSSSGSDTSESTTSAATSSSGTTSSGATSADSTSGSTTPASTSSTDPQDLSSTVSSASPSVQDVSGSTTTAPTSGTDTSLSTSGSGSAWSHYHHSGHYGAVAHQG